MSCRPRLLLRSFRWSLRWTWRLAARRITPAASRREAHARGPESVPEPNADRGGGVPFLMEAKDRVLDLGLLQPRPLGVRLDKRPRRAALSFAVCMQSSHRFLGGRLAYRGDVFKIHFARATAMMRNVVGVTEIGR